MDQNPYQQPPFPQEPTQPGMPPQQGWPQQPGTPFPPPGPPQGGPQMTPPGGPQPGMPPQGAQPGQGFGAQPGSPAPVPYGANPMMPGAAVPQKKSSAKTLIIVGGIIAGVAILFMIIGLVALRMLANSASSLESDSGAAPSGTVVALKDVSSPSSPLEIGQTVELSDGTYQITVHAVDLDATDAVLNRNGLNDPPKSGEGYIMVDITATRIAPGQDTPMAWVTYEAKDGTIYNEGQSSIYPNDFILETDELKEGESLRGNIGVIAPLDRDGALCIEFFGDNGIVEFYAALK